MEIFLKQVEIVAVEYGYEARIDKGGSDEVVAFGTTEKIALQNLLLAMSVTLTNTEAIPDGWVGGRPDNR